MIKRQWCWNLREKFVCFFMNGWKGARLGRLGICCVKKKNVLWKYTLLFDTSFFVCWLVFFFLKFYFFLPSQTWTLGFSLSRLQKILCLVFLFVRCVPFFLLFFFLFSFVCICFSQKFLDFFFPKISHFGICLLGFLRIFSPLILLLFLLFCCCLFLKLLLSVQNSVS